MYSYFIKSFGKYLSSLNKEGITEDSHKIKNQINKLTIDSRKNAKNKIEKCFTLIIDFLEKLGDNQSTIILFKRFNPHMFEIIKNIKTLKSLMINKIKEMYQKWKIQITDYDIEDIFFQNWTEQLDYLYDMLYKNNIDYFINNTHNANMINGYINNNTTSNNIIQGGKFFFQKNPNNYIQENSANNNSNSNSVYLDTSKSQQNILPIKSFKYKIKEYNFNDF